jgi:hypothetical protein
MNLLERFFPWELFEYIGVYDYRYVNKVESVLGSAAHKPKVAALRDWYY